MRHFNLTSLGLWNIPALKEELLFGEQMGARAEEADCTSAAQLMLPHTNYQAGLKLLEMFSTMYARPSI